MNPSRLFVMLAKLLPHALIIGLTLGMVEAAQAGVTFNVNSTADAVDANPGDGVCASATGECTLRAAIMETNAFGSPYDEDAIHLRPGNYVLSLPGAGEDAAATGDLDIAGTLKLVGAGSGVVSLDGNGVVTGDRVLQVHPFYHVTVEGVSIVGGVAADEGGGIHNSGTLTIKHSAIAGNATAAGRGGGIFTVHNLMLSKSAISGNSAASGGGIHAAGGSVTISQSTVTANSATDGGGIYQDWAASVTIGGSQISENVAVCLGGGIFSYLSTPRVTRSTVSGNSSQLCDGGGLYIQDGRLILNNSTISLNSALQGDGGGIYNLRSELQVTQSTISGNSALEGQGGGIFISATGIGSMVHFYRLFHSTVSANAAAAGGGIALSEGFNTFRLPTLFNTILAGNGAESNGPECLGPFSSEGFNLLGNNGGCTFTATTGDLVGTPDQPIDPLIGPLQSNGGPTWTHALLPGSPAIDAGTPIRCPTADQRGYARPVDGDGDGNPICDIGAFEFGALPAFDLTTEIAGFWPE